MNPSINNGLKKEPALFDFLYSPRELAVFIESKGLRLSRALGQNFLPDRNILKQMLESTGIPREGNILEIGPGLGHLTWLLLQRGCSVIAVEKDRTFARILIELASQRLESRTSLTVLQDDALSVNFAFLAEQHTIRHVIGNLPYNVAVPIIFSIAYCGYGFESCSFTLQKEVGERILTGPGSKEYGRLSIVLKYLYEVSKLKTIPSKLFYPRPKVESVFLKFIPKPHADIGFAQRFLERVIKIGFAHRRKKLRRQFKGSIVERRVFDESLMQRVENEFNLDQRGEEWDVETWVRFAEFISLQKPKE